MVPHAGENLVEEMTHPKNQFPTETARQVEEHHITHHTSQGGRSTSQLCHVRSQDTRDDRFQNPKRGQERPTKTTYQISHPNRECLDRRGEQGDYRFHIPHPKPARGAWLHMEEKGGRCQACWYVCVDI